ncbi:MAG TPA: T9SS type A sorting domain-containing protein [bacterium]
MKKLLGLTLVLCVFAIAGSLQAAALVGSAEDMPRVAGPVRSSSSLDEECTFNFLGFTYGTYSGSETWPGGSGTYYMTGYMLTSSCQTGDTLFGYCIDLDHALQHGAYCADIEDLPVRAAYPEQYPAMAYLLAWHPATSAIEDQIMQLSLWKMTNDQRPASPTSGAPWYTINGGRGYPNGDMPVYPYVNTVYNSVPDVNDAANARIVDALGTIDGLPKNVALCDDQLNVIVGVRDSVSDVVRVPVTVQLLRGANASAVGNTALSGVKLLMSASAGNLNISEAFTDAAGQVHAYITQPLGSHADIQFQVCTNGAWLKTITPCEGYSNQRVVTVNRCSLCVDRVIPGDSWLAAELASFDASIGDHRIELTWRSVSESNISRWEIERSQNGAAFSVLTIVAAANNATGQSYHAVDETALRGVANTYRLVDVDLNGTRTIHRDMQRTATLPAASAASLNYELAANYPNPFNPETSIRFSLVENGHTTLKVFDITGHEVATLADGAMSAGEHTVTFNAANLPSGIYFYKLTTGSFTQTRKMVLAK